MYPIDLTHNALDAIAHNRFPGGTTRCKPDLHWHIRSHFLPGRQPVYESHAPDCHRSDIFPVPIEQRPNKPLPLEPIRCRKPPCKTSTLSFRLLLTWLHSVGLHSLAATAVTYGKPLASFRAAAGQHLPAILRSHASAESVRVGPLTAARLIRTFHRGYILKG